MRGVKRIIALGLFGLLMGCAETHYKDLGVSVIGESSEGKHRTIRIEQKVQEIRGDIEDPIYIVEYTYTPCRISYTDFEDIDELPTPLPMSLLPSRTGCSGFHLQKYTEIPKPDDVLHPGIPYQVGGKKRVSKESLDILIASGRVKPVYEYSLGNVVVSFSLR